MQNPKVVVVWDLASQVLAQTQKRVNDGPVQFIKEANFFRKVCSWHNPFAAEDKVGLYGISTSSIGKT